VEIFSLIVIHGTLDATEASVAIVEQDGWYVEISNRTVAQEPA